MKKIISVFVLAACMAGMLLFAGCEGSGQEYAWVLATASPEDTVTQLYAEKFAEEVERLSDGEMRIDVYANSSLAAIRNCWRAACAAISPLSCRIRRPR